MGLVKELADWREMLTNDRDEGEPEPSEEDVLGQFTFSLISDLLEEQYQEIVDFLAQDEDDEPKFLLAWLDRRAAS